MKTERNGGGRSVTNFEDNGRTSMTLNEREPLTRPVLYKSDGTALYIPKSPVGFVRPKR